MDGVLVDSASLHVRAYEHVFLMDRSLAGLVFGWMAGEKAPKEIGDEHLDAVKETAAQLLGQLRAAFEGEGFTFPAGEVQLVEVPSQEELGLPEEGLVATYRFTRGKKKQEYLVTHVLTGEPAPEVVEGTAAEEPVEKEPEAEEVAAEGAAETTAEETAEAAAGLAEDLVGDEDITKEVAEGISDDLPLQGEEDLVGAADMADLFGGEGDEGGVVEVSPAEFGELGEAAPGDGKGRKIDLLLDVELDVSVELGRKIMIVGDILRLGKGSVIELNKLAGEPVDVLVNGKKLAEGEVVVVEDHFGVRLTHLLDPKERIKSLGK